MSAIQELTSRREIGTINSKMFYLNVDGAYTRMLHIVLNISWRDHITDEDLYGHLPKVSTKIREVAGNFVRHKEEEQGFALTKIVGSPVL